jgi:hypothetical protein
VFPHSKYAISFLLECFGVSGVPLAVTLDLGCPIITVHFPGADAAWTAVPVATIYEDHNSAFWEQEVRFAWQTLWVHLPTAEARANKEGS